MIARMVALTSPRKQQWRRPRDPRVRILISPVGYLIVGCSVVGVVRSRWIGRECASYGLGYRGWCWQMSTRRTEAILVGYVVHLNRCTVGSRVRESSLHRLGLLSRCTRFGTASFRSRNSIFRLVAPGVRAIGERVSLLITNRYESSAVGVVILLILRLRLLISRRFRRLREAPEPTELPQGRADQCEDQDCVLHDDDDSPRIVMPI